MFNALTLATAIGCALIGGVFFAFSTFVMRALGNLPPAQGIAAMQSINIVVINPLFLGVFMGTTLTSLILAGGAVMNWGRPGALYCLLGAALYVIGTFGVTMVFNVPRNNALAAVDPASAQGAALWADYLRIWTMWNSVRTVAALAAAVMFGLAR